MRDLILGYEQELEDSRIVILALLNTVTGRVHDKECVRECRRLVDRLQERWSWRDPRDRRNGGETQP